MTVFICIDERGGMIFNKRRQSRDRLLIEDVERISAEGILYISDFSEDLFADSEVSAISVSNPLESAKEGSYAFVELPPLKPYLAKINRLIIYKWNERYPYDRKIDFSPEEEGYRLVESFDFEGRAHERITRETYDK